MILKVSEIRVITTTVVMVINGFSFLTFNLYTSLQLYIIDALSQT